MAVRRSGSLESRIPKYLAAEGYKGMGVMSRELHVRMENLKWTLNKMVFERKIEPVVYGGIRLYRVRNPSSSMR